MTEPFRISHEAQTFWRDTGRVAHVAWPEHGPLGAWRASGMTHPERRTPERWAYLCFEVGYFEAKEAAQCAI
jgi:hypothetical protein